MASGGWGSAPDPADRYAEMLLRTHAIYDITYAHSCVNR